MLCANMAHAEPPAPPSTTEIGSAVSELVDKQLLTPLKKVDSKRRRFSRAAPVPVQRRIRVLDTVAVTDVRGKQFVRFAIDTRRSFDEHGSWQQDSVVGCAYLNERQVFVRHGDAYRPARSLLGEDQKERPGVCRATADGVGQVASAAR